MKSIKILMAFLLLAAFSLVAQDTAITAMVEKAQKDMGKSMIYTNGDFMYGTLKKGEAYYGTLTFYKSNKYSIAFGASDKAKKLKVYLYKENMLELVTKKIISAGQQEIVHIEAPVTGHYYLKVYLEEGGDDTGWFYLYGFKE